MKHLGLLVVLSALAAACAPQPNKVDFNERTFFDQDVQGEDRIKINCGATFKATFTNTDSTFSTLEVNNDGGCDVTALVTEQVPGSGLGAVTPVVEFKVAPGVGNVTAFPLTPSRKFNLSFTCGPSTSTKECEFSYRFSTGKAAAQPSRESPKVDERPVNPEGLDIGNACITKAGKEAIGKVISNLTSGEIKVTFTAQSTCQCVPFSVFSDTPDSRNVQADTPTANASATGTAFVAAGKTITLKAKCSDNVKAGKCSGIVKDIKFSITTK